MNEQSATPITHDREKRTLPLATLALGGLLVLIGTGWLLETLGVTEVPWGALPPPHWSSSGWPWRPAAGPGATAGW